MNADKPGAPHRLPTLTEVVALPPVQPEPMADTAAAAPGPASVQMPLQPPPELEADLIVQRVLADLQRQIDLMLEVRLREVLAPVLARATDTLVRDARSELASTLRDLVARAVAQELARHRGRDPGR